MAFSVFLITIIIINCIIIAISVRIVEIIYGFKLFGFVNCVVDFSLFFYLTIIFVWLVGLWFYSICWCFGSLETKQPLRIGLKVREKKLLENLVVLNWKSFDFFPVQILENVWMLSMLCSCSLVLSSSSDVSEKSLSLVLVGYLESREWCVS